MQKQLAIKQSSYIIFINPLAGSLNLPKENRFVFPSLSLYHKDNINGLYSTNFHNNNHKVERKRK